MSQLELTYEIMHTPVPNMDLARELRSAGYAGIMLAADHELGGDPVVALSEYGIASQSYYSRPNVTGDPVPGVRAEVLVRKDIAERLSQVSEFIETSEFIKKHCGGEVEIYVEEGLRSIGLQAKVHHEIYPNFLRNLHPDWSEEAITVERDRRVAKPSEASPHASGGAIDLKMRMVNKGEGNASYGFDHAEKLTIRPDYFETHDGLDTHRINRRIAFHIMTAAGFVNNPEEVWHFGRGDRLSHVVSPAIMPSGLVVPAYYAAVQGAPELAA